MILGDTIIAASTLAEGSFQFDVNQKSVILYVFPDAGTELTENNSFRLSRVVAADGRALPCVEPAGQVLMGGNRTSLEIMERGTYLLEKIIETTEAVGARMITGFEEQA